MKKLSIFLNHGIYGMKEAIGYGRDGLASHKEGKLWLITHVASGMTVANKHKARATKAGSLYQQEQLHKIAIDWTLSEKELQQALRENIGAIYEALDAMPPVIEAETMKRLTLCRLSLRRKQ